MKHIFTLLTLLASSAALLAGESAEHGHSHEHIVVPATLPEVRAAIAAKQSELSAALGAKDAAAAHTATDALAAFVKAVPAMADGLDETAKQRVAGMANNAARAWSEAAHEAEHGDYEKAAREAAKAEAAYRLLEARLTP
jgi:hypothetical protein